MPYTCKSCFCSACGKKATEIWIEKQNAVLPQCEYQHISSQKNLVTKSL
ncbi:hypothetical protein GW535_17320 (plasmid) [Piscirickettsia salmonis]|nr:hypothetical protein GW535_17320 [Piscirickettsia salmonis]QIX57426.1 hypothetical protein GW536_18745 [Piscirickettsia salmonis]QNR79806.1 transposase zinc-binding domain-containing protein [Piscirickettsia salmonis]